MQSYPKDKQEIRKWLNKEIGTRVPDVVWDKLSGSDLVEDYLTNAVRLGLGGEEDREYYLGLILQQAKDYLDVWRDGNETVKHSKRKNRRLKKFPANEMYWLAEDYAQFVYHNYLIQGDHFDFKPELLEGIFGNAWSTRKPYGFWSRYANWWSDCRRMKGERDYLRIQGCERTVRAWRDYFSELNRYLDIPYEPEETAFKQALSKIPDRPDEYKRDLATAARSLSNFFYRRILGFDEILGPPLSDGFYSPIRPRGRLIGCPLSDMFYTLPPGVLDNRLEAVWDCFSEPIRSAAGRKK